MTSLVGHHRSAVAHLPCAWSTSQVERVRQPVVAKRKSPPVLVPEEPRVVSGTVAVIPDAGEVESPPGITRDSSRARLQRCHSHQRGVSEDSSCEASLAGVNRAVIGVAVAESLIGKPSVQEWMCNWGSGNSVVCDRGANV